MTKGTNSSAANSNSITYLCRDLILDSSYQIRNPFSRGRGYFCGSCNKTYDDSLVYLRKKPEAVTSTIDDIRNQDLTFEYIPEDRGIGPDAIEDEYKKYGARIVDSRIEKIHQEGIGF